MEKRALFGGGTFKDHRGLPSSGSAGLFFLHVFADFHQFAPTSKLGLADIDQSS